MDARMEESGGVFHKLTTLRFPAGDVMPEDDTAPLYLSPISATATGCFAGVMAMSWRIYSLYDEAFAASCLQARTCLAWLEANPGMPGFRNPPDIATGEYGDGQDADERYWAAELYRATGEARYHEAFQALARQDSFGKYELGWADMGGYGTFAYLMSERKRSPRWHGNCWRVCFSVRMSLPLSVIGTVMGSRRRINIFGRQYGGIESCDAPAGGGKTVWL